jgi:hypothetical protein
MRARGFPVSRREIGCRRWDDDGPRPLPVPRSTRGLRCRRPRPVPRSTRGLRCRRRIDSSQALGARCHRDIDPVERTRIDARQASSREGPSGPIPHRHRSAPTKSKVMTGWHRPHEGPAREGTPGRRNDGRNEEQGTPERRTRSDRNYLAGSARDHLAHTRAMRQWACVFALLLGLTGSGYAASARIRTPIPIERRLDSWAHDGRLIRTLDWWRA